jgi:hypothetical protein
LVKNASLIFLYCLLAAATLTVQAHANPIPSPPENIMTMIHIQQNGVPVNDTVNFSMNCYGTFYNQKSLKNQNRINSELVFNYSITCPPGDCALFNSYDTRMMSINFCNVEGTYKGKSFIIKNFSKAPKSDEDCLPILKGELNSGKHYYTLTYKNYRFCQDQLENKIADDCNQYLQKASDGGNPEEYIILNNAKYTKTVILNDTKYEKTTQYIQCVNDAGPTCDRCWENSGQEINESIILQDPISPPTRYCELQINIPSDDQTPINSLISSTIGSPVESLYCTILSIFGAKC